MNQTNQKIDSEASPHVDVIERMSVNLPEIETIYNEYISDPDQFLEQHARIWREQINIRIKQIEVHRNNRQYEIIREIIERFTNVLGLTFGEQIIHSMVENNGYVLKIHNVTSIGLNNGAHLNFCPNGDHGMEISRVYVPAQFQNRGYGSELMTIFLAGVNCGNFDVSPDVILECTGTVGYGPTTINTPISDQTRFFRKFGFRVSNSESSYPRFLTMRYDREKVTDETTQDSVRFRILRRFSQN